MEGTDKGQPKYSNKNLHQYHLSNINPTGTGSDLRGEGPATNCLSHGRALSSCACLYWYKRDKSLYTVHL
jgi:hypothetical protein